MAKRLYYLNRDRIVKNNLGYSDLELDLENVSMKLSLAKSSAHALSNENSKVLPQND